MTSKHILLDTVLDAMLACLSTALAFYPSWRLGYEVLEGTIPRRCGCSPLSHYPEYFEFLRNFFILILAPGLNLILGRLLQVQSRAFVGLQAFMSTVMLVWAMMR